MPRRCLDCPALIQRGSRCSACARAYRSPYSRHQWAEAVKGRAGYRCQRCGSTERIAAHHRVPLAAGGADSPTNGIALCHACHGAAHGHG